MKLGRPHLVVIALVVVACSDDPKKEPTATEPQRRATPRTSRCVVDPASLSDLPDFGSDREGETDPSASGGAPILRFEPIADPELGLCTEERDLLTSNPLRGFLSGALRGEGEQRRFALHRVRDLALLGEGPFLLTAESAGIFLVDVPTLARRARLADTPATAVASSPDGHHAAALIEDDAKLSLIVFELPSLKLLAKVEDAPRGRLRFTPDGERIALLTAGGVFGLPLEAPRLERHSSSTEAGLPPDPEIPREALEGNATDVVRGRGDRYVIATDRGQIRWFDGGTPIRSFGPLVLAMLGDDARLALDDQRVVFSFLGELFRWDGGDQAVRAPTPAGRILLQDANDTDVIVVARRGNDIAIHRVAGESRPAATSRELDRLPWADALLILRGKDGRRAVLGLDFHGVRVAFVSAEGSVSSLSDALDLKRSVQAAEVGEGRYALWDRHGVVYALDLNDQRAEQIGRIESPAPGMTVRFHPRRGYEAFSAAGRRLAIAEIEAEGTE